MRNIAALIVSGILASNAGGAIAQPQRVPYNEYHGEREGFFFDANEFGTREDPKGFYQLSVQLTAKDRSRVPYAFNGFGYDRASGRFQEVYITTKRGGCLSKVSLEKGEQVFKLCGDEKTLDLAVFMEEAEQLLRETVANVLNASSRTKSEFATISE